MSRERDERGLSTADLASATQETQGRKDMPVPEVERHDASMEDARAEREELRRDESMQVRDEAGNEGTRLQGEPLAALFDPDLSQDFRMHWTNVQIGFVDDPRRAVQQADELVAQVMKSLAESFARQRAEIEAGMGSGEQASTENLRVALRRYRSFFERLLSL